MTRFSYDLYVITEEVQELGRTHLQVAEAGLRGGAQALQFRDKEMDTRDLLETGEALRQVARKAGAIFIINDRVDVALAVEADGVHLGDRDLPVEIARRILGKDRIIGASVANMEEARAAEQAGADYLAVGSIFASSTKPAAGPPIGLGPIRAIKQASNLPLVAIGGINAENVAQVISAGADAAAVISAVSRAPDMEQAARELASEIAKAKAAF